MKKQTAMSRDYAATARTLSEALPYLQRFNDAIVVIKFGGHAMGDDEAMATFARDIVLMRQVGVNPVIVHGGGPMINEMLKKLGVISEFVDGKRVTDAATVEVVEMVLSGSVNKRIVQAINAQGGRAVGLSGKDANLITCDPEDPKFGFVGVPNDVNPEVLHNLFKDKIIPVVAPLGAGRGGETFNINGDTAAGAIAAALKADRLLLLTDVAGVKDASGEVVTELSAEDVVRMTADGIIAGGMILKTQTALANFTASVAATPATALRSAVAPFQPTVAAGAQLRLQVSVECMQPFAESPKLSLAYVHNGVAHAFDLALPVVPTSFVEPTNMAAGDFIKHFKSMAGGGREAQSTLKAGAVADWAAKMRDVKALFSGPLHMAVLDGVDPKPENICAVGTYKTGTTAKDGKSKINVGTMVRLETNTAAAMFRVTVRASHGAVAKAVAATIAKVLE